MPKISVVVPTMRVGGLDVLFNGLAGQSFKDFELVLSDGLHRFRKDVVEERAAGYGFPVKHVEPADNPFPVNSFCRHANAGLVHASGEIVVMFVDYTWAHPGCLQTHADFHDANPGRSGLVCPHRYLMLPDLKLDLYPTGDRYSDSSIDAYVRDLESGRLSPVMWSIFRDDLTDAGPLPGDPYGADPKMSMPTGPVGPDVFFAKNESVRTSDLVEVNGWNEDMDGTHGYQDWDLSERLSHRLGLRWFHIRENVADIVNPRLWLPHGKRLHPFDANRVVLERCRASGYPNPNSWSLADERKRAHGV